MKKSFASIAIIVTLLFGTVFLVYWFASGAVSAFQSAKKIVSERSASPGKPEAATTKASGSTIVLSLPVPVPAKAEKPTVAGKPTFRVSPESASVRKTASAGHIADTSECTKFRALYDPDGPEGPLPEGEVSLASRWESSSPEAVHLNGPGSFYDKGVFASTSPGETTITATYQGFSAAARLETKP